MTRRRALIAVYVILLLAGFAIAQALPDWSELARKGIADPDMRLMLIAVLVIYVLAAAIPFIPGAEIGFGILAMFGWRSALLVYLCMILALSLAYLAGRFVPTRRVAAAFAFAGLTRASDLVLRSSELDFDRRAQFLEQHLPKRIVPYLLRHRYVTLALLLNIPGNSLLGGGGGLAFAAGASRIFGALPFLITILVAVAPVPVAVVLTRWGP